MRIAAYCRVSTEKDEQLDSLEHQKRFFAEYAEKNGHRLVQLYADEGISGTSLRRREAFLQLMQDARQGRFDAVVVKDISRFARNTVDFLQSIRELKALGINTVFITANMESLGESEFVLTIFGAMAQEESANLSKRVKFGKKLNAEKGRVPPKIYGYDRLDNFTLSICYPEAKVVREIFHLYLEEGLGCRTISQQLNQEGHRTKEHCSWNPRTVRRVLTNPIYCGHYVNHRSEVRDYLTGQREAVPQEEQFHHSRPEWAIIPPEIFEQAQTQLELRREQYRSQPDGQGTRHSSKHLFSTLIRCECCGRAFCRKHYTYAKTRIYWTCSTRDRYTADQCENGVKLEEDLLCDRLRTYLASRIRDREAFLDDVWEDFLQSRSGETVLIPPEELRKWKRELTRKQEKYREMYAADAITMEELKEKSASLTAQLNALKRDLHPPTHPGEDQEERTRWRKETERFLSLETMTNVDLRKLLSGIIVNKDGTVCFLLNQVGEDPS